MHNSSILLRRYAKFCKERTMMVSRRRTSLVSSASSLTQPRLRTANSSYNASARSKRSAARTSSGLCKRESSKRSEVSASISGKTFEISQTDPTRSSLTDCITLQPINMPRTSLSDSPSSQSQAPAPEAFGRQSVAAARIIVDSASTVSRHRKAWSQKCTLNGALLPRTKFNFGSHSTAALFAQASCSEARCSDASILPTSASKNATKLSSMPSAIPRTDSKR
mmetsp:Transcript_100395/g.289961  ORF Transcript_100395/g.289961 Transcript_100395/m.289961 type:complete len:223 (+) Transcript_100395:21-689(+)